MGLVIGTFAVLQFSKGLPDAHGIRQIELKVPLRVYSADGLLISEFGSERRIPIDFEDTPKALVDAVLASEDDNFFNHPGIDLFGLVRAALANFSSGRTGQGASTITMQVARNFYLSPEKTYTRKIKEILLAIRLEQVLEKKEILSLYLNKIFLGHRAYGFGAAAEAYYGKSLHELDLPQIAMLAGLPKAPSSYNPIRNAERATIRRNYVLQRMRSLEWINEADFNSAVEAPVTAKRHARDTGLDAPHIAEMVRAQLTEQYGEGAYWAGLNVYTTIQSDKQKVATSALRAGLQAYDRRHGYRGPVARVNLEQTVKSEETAFESYENILRDYPDSHEQTPAIVSGIDDTDQATLWSRESGPIKLGLAQVKWAKKHISANRVSAAPKTVSDVLQVGDVVYVKPKIQQTESTTRESLNSEVSKQWELTQLPSVSGSIVSLNPKTGGIISLVGGYDFFINKYNRATQSIRQPGSNIKPFIYSAALEKGFTPASLISGAPIVLTDPAHGTRWRPENYSGKFFGPTRMREALAKSMNLVSIRLLRAIGIPYARSYLERFGLDMSRFSNSLTMALGSGGIKPMEMITAYATLANGGYQIKPYFIEKITDRDGNEIFVAPKPFYCDACIADYIAPELNNALDEEGESRPIIDEPELEVVTPSEATAVFNAPTQSETTQQTSYQAPRVMSHASNFLIVSMLKEVIRRGTARKALVLERNDLAGKTGTTNDYVDAWFSGFNSQVVTTVWVGFDQPTSMGRGEAGSLAALPIWVDYMKVGLEGIPQDKIDTPNFVEAGFVDRSTGERVDQTSPGAREEFFVIDELTPEYTLLSSSFSAEGDGSDRSLDSELDAETALQLLEANDGLIDGEALNQPLEEPERIIESEDETDGLF